MFRTIVLMASLIDFATPVESLAQSLRTYNGSPYLNQYPYKTPLWSGQSSGGGAGGGSGSGGGGWGGLSFPSGNWRQEEQMRQMRLRQQQYMQQQQRRY